jgi:ABC-type polysaccharide/polyol phosphate transport system ATPase subunit
MADPIVEFHQVGKRYDPTASPFGTSTTLVRMLLRRRAAEAGDEDDGDDDDEEVYDDAIPGDEDFGTKPVWAVRDLSFAVEPAQRVGIVGPTGSGKSTVLRLIAGATQPSAGRIVLRGRVGPLPALADTFMRTESPARQNAMLAARVAGANTKVARAAADEACELVGFEPRDPAPGGGAGLRRLATMVAVSVRSDLLLIDALPTGAGTYATAFQEQLRRRLSEGAALVVTGNDRDQVASMCSHVVELQGPREAPGQGLHGRKGARPLEWDGKGLLISPFHRFAAMHGVTATVQGGALHVAVGFETAMPRLGVRCRLQFALADGIHVVDQPHPIRCGEAGLYRLEGHLEPDVLPRGQATASLEMDLEYEQHATGIEREDCFSIELDGALPKTEHVTGGTWQVS